MNPLWIVTNCDGPDLACETREQAMEHCAIMAGDFPQCAPWNVTEYVPASDLAAAKAERDLAQTSGVTTSNYWKQRADDMEADIAAAKADAERYRWLRDGNNDVEGIASCASGEAMDAAIDAAIAGSDK